MAGNIFGTIFKIVSFGESHGKCVGCVIDGCPAGLKILKEDIQIELDKRKPGKGKYSTTRKEKDEVEILSGIFNGYTTGAPICMLVWNKDVDSSKYEKLKDIPRPGHADYTARIKYGGYNDYRGGGRFSGRITISIVLAGAIAKKILKEKLNIEIFSYTKSIGSISSDFTPKKIDGLERDEATGCIDSEVLEAIHEELKSVKNSRDSLGGTIETVVKNIPVGLGDPFFDTIEGDISKIMFAIPAIKGFDFGSGFSGSKLKGSENNDPYIIKNDKIMTKTNNSGGVLGGITSGMPLIFRVAVKPTPSISKTQKSVDLSEFKEVELKIEGRHDSLIVPRAIPVIENAIAIVLLDHLLRAHKIQNILG
ncbi:MAG: chorismate synthase [Candidatus Lokiarchaeota archaeon]|nr:chorismate synthase [Candidatus Lokiarchaeota archaeon]